MAQKNRMLNTIKRITAAGTALTCLLWTPGVLQARVVAVEPSVVNVREGASTATKAISKVKDGEIFGWYGLTDNWSQIKLANGNLGFIRNDLLTGYDELTVTGSLVRVRQSPSLTGPILTKVSKGKALPVLDHQKGWFKVQLTSGFGWISGDYISLEKPVVLNSTETAAAKPNITQPVLPPAPIIPVVVDGSQTGQLAGKVIVLDPGHGINASGIQDPGAKGTVSGVQEKDVNLDIAFKLRSVLEKMGATVIMTHTGETALNLYGRAAVANQAQAHIFVSIHANSSLKANYSGHSTYFYAPANHATLGSQRAIRQKLAQSVQAELVKAGGRTDLGVLENNYVVIRETYCPSILVETAFLSNAEEDKLLCSGAYRQQLAQGIAKGIMTYFGVA